DLAKQMAAEDPNRSAAVVTISMSEDDIEAAVSRFRDETDCDVLVCDSALEEGRNLQFADGLVFFDIPFAPMRLEQRIGRLDRLDRVNEVEVQLVLTLDDETAAPDAAWRKVLVNGLGIFESSLADLQMLVERQMPWLLERLLQGGPQALVAAAPELR